MTPGEGRVVPSSRISIPLVACLLLVAILAFLIVGLIYERRHTKAIAEFGGLASVMPVYATLTLIIFLASMGLPMLNGFIGELMILQGAFSANRAWAYWAVSGIVLGAAYLLWLYQRVFWGKVTNEENRHLTDLSPREILVFAPLILAVLWMGIHPDPILGVMHTSVQNVVERLDVARVALEASAQAVR